MTGENQVSKLSKLSKDLVKDFCEALEKYGPVKIASMLGFRDTVSIKQWKYRETIPTIQKTQVAEMLRELSKNENKYGY